MSFGRLAAISAPLIGLLGTTAAYADPVSETAPLVSDELREFEPTGFDLGGVRVLPKVQYVAFVDNNVFTTPTDTKGDAVFTMAGVLEARHSIGKFDLRTIAAGSLNRYADFAPQNSETATIEGSINWQPRVTQKLNLTGAWRRVVEERGTPESRLGPGSKERLLNIFEGLGTFSHEGGPMVYTANVELRKYDFLGPANDERDFNSNAGSFTISRSIGTKFYGTATGYITHRDFSIRLRSNNSDQDETTIGGRVGIATRGDGLVQGRASIGMFRLNPADPLEKSRTGISADVALTYRPQPRTAFLLNIFSGDAATFRLGAVARADTRMSIGVQQEIRHNLYASASLQYLKWVFLGSSDAESAITPRLEVEYLATRTVSVAGFVNFTHRTSNIPEENFDKFRGGISLRLRY